MSHGFSLEPILIVLIAAVIVAVVFQQIKVSPILGYLVAGALIGEHGLNLFDDQEAAARLGDLGVVFLLFVIGLELSYARLRVIRRRLFALGAAQVAITSVLIAAICYFYADFNGAVSVLVGGALALSSTAMVLQLLIERGEISSRSGRGAFAILLVQDVAVIPLLALLPIVGGGPGSSWLALGTAAVNAVAAIIAIVVIGRFILRPVYRVVAATRSNELFVALSLFVVLGVGFLTDQVGLSMTLGAFLAGVMLAETQYRHQIEADIEPFRGLLLALFFISVGLSIDVASVAQNWVSVFGLAIGLLVFKMVIIVALGLIVRLPLSVAGHMGILLAQGGEFAFVVLGSASVLGIIPATLAGYLITVVALTMVVTPLVLAPLGSWWEARLRNVGRETQTLRDPSDSDEMADHAIIAGFGRTGRAVAQMLRDARVPYVAIDTNIESVSAGRSEHLPVFYGDAGRKPILDSAGVERARTLVVAIDRPGATERVVIAARRINPGLRIIARSRDREHATALEQLGADSAIPELEETSLRLGAAALRNVGQVEEQVDAFVRELRSDDYAALRDEEAQTSGEKARK